MSKKNKPYHIDLIDANLIFETHESTKKVTFAASGASDFLELSCQLIKLGKVVLPF